MPGRLQNLAIQIHLYSSISDLLNTVKMYQYETCHINVKSTIIFRVTCSIQGTQQQRFSLLGIICESSMNVLVIQLTVK